MKFFDTDWNCVFRWLAVWTKLSPATRRHYLLGVPSHALAVSAKGYGDELAAVLELGLVETVAAGRCKPVAASVPFRAVMAQLAKFPIFDRRPSHELLHAYTRKHYLREESDIIQNGWKSPAWNSLGWPEEFLAQTDVRAWEESHLARFETHAPPSSPWRGPGEPILAPRESWFPDAETIEAAHALVRAAIDAPQPRPLHALAGALPERLRSFLSPALKACLRYMLLYPALRQDTLDAVIGLCPTVVFLRNRPPAKKPAAQSCASLVGPAFLVEDMTRVLAAAVIGECRYNRRGYGRQFFKVIEDRFREDFVLLPPWMHAQANFGERLFRATEFLISLKLATDHDRGGRRRLEATAHGRRWLAQPPGDRLHDFLSELRRLDPEGPTCSEDSCELLPGQLRFAAPAPDEFDHLSWLDSIWRQAPVTACAAVEAFLDYHARVNHPLVNPIVPTALRPIHAFRFDSGEGSTWVRLREDKVEEFTREMLALFFWDRLVPLGCVETGVNQSGQVCFRLSKAGRFLFGLTPERPSGQPATEAAVVT